MSAIWIYEAERYRQLHLIDAERAEKAEAERDSLVSKIKEEVERHREVDKDRRWHPFIRQQRRVCADRLAAILSDVEGGGS